MQAFGAKRPRLREAADEGLLNHGQQHEHNEQILKREVCELKRTLIVRTSLLEVAGPTNHVKVEEIGEQQVYIVCTTTGPTATERTHYFPLQHCLLGLNYEKSVLQVLTA